MTVTFALMTIVFAQVVVQHPCHAEVARHKRQATFAFSPAVFSYCINTSTPLNQAIGAVTVTNTGATTTWTITSPNSNFAINPTTGVITTNNFLQAGTVQVLTVRATSSTGAAIATNVVIRTSPCTSPTSTIAPTAASSSSVPTFSSTSFTFSTAGTLGQLVGTASATSATTASYSLSGTNSQYFALNPSTGQLYLFRCPPTATVTFNVIARNTAGSTTVPVTVTSTCLQTTTTTTVATTTAATVRFGQASYTFTPACTAGSIVGQVFANSPNGVVGYTITPATNLAVDSFGVISVVTTLAPSTTASYTVTATDSAGLTNSAPVTVTTNASCTAAASGGATTAAPTATTPAGGGPSV